LLMVSELGVLQPHRACANYVVTSELPESSSNHIFFPFAFNVSVPLLADC